MKGQCRIFLKEFKHVPAHLVVDQSDAIQQASLSLQVDETAIGRWVHQPKAKRDEETPADKAQTGKSRNLIPR